MWNENAKRRRFDLMMKPGEPKEVFQQRSSMTQSLSRRIIPVGGWKMKWQGKDKADQIEGHCMSPGTGQ